MNSERYIKLKPMSEGGNGNVYIGYDRQLGRKCAIKEVVTGKDDYRTEAEINALKSIREMGIPVLTDAYYEADRWTLVMDLISGITLRDYVLQKGCLEDAECVKLAVELLLILHRLHSMTPQLVHGDIKPDNIVIRNGHLFLVDFGSVHTPGEQTHGLEFSGGYTAPEVFEGREKTVACDIFAAAGVILFCLTGEEYTTGPDISVMCSNLQNEAWRPVLCYMSRTDPYERCKDAGEAAALIRGVVGHKKKIYGSWWAKAFKKPEIVRVKSIFLSEGRL